jgi:hypothetical protein
MSCLRSLSYFGNSSSPRIKQQRISSSDGGFLHVLDPWKPYSPVESLRSKRRITGAGISVCII